MDTRAIIMTQKQARQIKDVLVSQSNAIAIYKDDVSREVSSVVLTALSNEIARLRELAALFEEMIGTGEGKPND